MKSLTKKLQWPDGFNLYDKLFSALPLCLPFSLCRTQTCGKLQTTAMFFWKVFSAAIL